MTPSANRIAGGKFWSSWWPIVLGGVAAYVFDWSSYQIVTVWLLGYIAWLLWLVVEQVDRPEDPPSPDAP
jgi:hypothetical protein